jgi:FtsP/CotA-like multicopper oxidase with cupredoxin domain
MLALAGQVLVWPRIIAAQSADITLRITELTHELGPRRSVKTVAYNGQVPGPLLRARAGRPLTVDVFNETKREELVHWHGFHIPAEVDGAREEGTPVVPPGGQRRYTFVPRPAGTRWYHSHGMAGRSLDRTTYTGQFGMFIVESEDSGSYDQEIPILLHEWAPRFAPGPMGAMDLEFRYHSINGKMLGAGEPLRVREHQRVLFRIVNASATLHHQLALPGHTFHVTALDGFAVPVAKDVPVLAISPGERVDAIVEMSRPGIWVLGETDPAQRTAGLGIVVEYAGGTGAPQWRDPSAFEWDYSLFGSGGAAPQPDEQRTFVFRPTDDRHHWTINGRSHPNIDPIAVRAGTRSRWLFDNQSAEMHPVHLHRHTFELVTVAGKPCRGISKDVVVVPAWKQVEVDVVTNEPGPSLFHCHQQFHMDMGFMTMMQYSGG